MIIANFTNNQDVRVAGLNQYDYGQVLRIQGLKLPTAVEIHFGLEETGGTTTTRIGVTKDGVTDVVIPDSMLENGDTSLDYAIYVFIYLTDETSGKTVHRIKMQVNARSKPEQFDKPSDTELFREAIKAVNQSAKEAEGWAHGREDMPERATDNAKYYAESVKGVEQNVKDMVATIGGIEQQVQDVKKFAGQAQSASEKALLSEQEAKKSEEASLQHRTGAETAENNAELAEQNAKKSEQAVEQAKVLVEQVKQEVASDKVHIDGQVTAFDRKVTEANSTIDAKKTESLSAIGTAKTDATNAISTAKTDALGTVGTAKTDAVNAVTAEGTAQAKKVTDEGTKQVGAVNTEAQKHQKAMQEAVNGIVTDRQQIAQNKTDVTRLKEDLKGFIPKQQGSENKGKALVVGEDGNVAVGEVQGGDGIPIINTMSGESPLVVLDSAERVNKGLSIIGNTLQNQDPPPSPDNPQEIKNVGKWNEDKQKYEVGVKFVTGNTLPPADTLQGYFYGESGNKLGFTKSSIAYSYEIPKEKFLRGTLTVNLTSVKKSRLIWIFTDADNNVLYKFHDSSPNYTTKHTCVVPDGSEKMCISVFDANVEETTELAIYPGKEVLSYSPYKEQIITITSDRPITKWDKLVEQDGQIGWLYGGKIIESYNSEPIDTEYISSTGELSVGATVLYKLKGAEFVPLPQSEQDAFRTLKTYYPTTVITADGGEVNPDVEVTYIADTKNYIDQKIAAIGKTVVETQKALL